LRELGWAQLSPAQAARAARVSDALGGLRLGTRDWPSYLFLEGRAPKQQLARSVSGWRPAATSDVTGHEGGKDGPIAVVRAARTGLILG
jgi:hypothetical protein